MSDRNRGNDIAALDSSIVDSFVSFFSGYLIPGLGLPALKTSYTWSLPRSASDFIGTLPEGNGYDANVGLKIGLHEKWKTSEDEQVRRNIAHWVIKNWGGVRGNRDETLAGYVDMADAEEPLTPIKGVASYSKLLSIVHPSKYAIYDARVAVALNAVQLFNGRKGIVFPYVSGRNKITGDSVNKRGFAKLRKFSARELERQGWTVIAPRVGYQMYIQLLNEVRSRFTHKHELHDFEMTLFSQAEQLAIRVAPELVTPHSYNRQRPSTI